MANRSTTAVQRPVVKRAMAPAGVYHIMSKEEEVMPTTTPPAYYPILLDLRGRRCLVVGGGAVARRKVNGLLEAGASVIVVAPHIADMPPGAQCVHRPFTPDDLADAALVIAATDDAAVNAAVAEEAHTRRIWVNVVDAPEAGNCILPAVVRRGAFQLAISTGGASPAFARRLRRQLAQAYGAEYGELVELLWRLRQAWEPLASAAGVSGPARRRAWEQVLELPLLEHLCAGEGEMATALAWHVLQSAITAWSPRDVECS